MPGFHEQEGSRFTFHNPDTTAHLDAWTLKDDGGFVLTHGGCLEGSGCI